MQPAECDAVSAFKQQLGIHDSEDAAFGWIAEVGLQSPLPPRWTSHTDTSSGFVYYVDHDRQVSSWENPLVPFLRRVVEIGRNYQKQPQPGFFEDQKGLLWHQHKHELDCWHGPFADEGGRQYFVNSTEGVSSWSDPRVDAQYIFELESGLLTSLEEVLSQPSPDTPGFGPETTGRHWKSADGADVLTLDSPGGATLPRPATGRPDLKAELLTKAKWNAKEEHKSVLERMTSTAVRMHDMKQDDLEAQRLQVTQKVKERRQRKRLSETAEDPSPASAPVRIPPSPLAPGGPPAPPAPAGPQAPPVPAGPQAPDAAGPQPPAAGGLAPAGGGFMPPPPPPPMDGATALPPELAPGAEDDSHDLDIFKPPSLLPSPTAGNKPTLPLDLEQRLRPMEALQGADLGTMELRTDGGGPVAES